LKPINKVIYNFILLSGLYFLVAKPPGHVCTLLRNVATYPDSAWIREGEKANSNIKRLLTYFQQSGKEFLPYLRSQTGVWERGRKMIYHEVFSSRESTMKKEKELKSIKAKEFKEQLQLRNNCFNNLTFYS
jgi:hypothetical protein